MCFSNVNFVGEGTAGFVVLDNDDMYCVGYHKRGILAGKKTAKFPRKVEALCGIEITGKVSDSVKLLKILCY